MDPDLREKAEKQHKRLMEAVELAIAKLYAAKEHNEHLDIWYAVGALEVYKMQSTFMFKSLFAGFGITEEQRELGREIRDALTEQLETISDMVRPLLLTGSESSDDVV
jgi:hypothetical protein